MEGSWALIRYETHDALSATALVTIRESFPPPTVLGCQKTAPVNVKAVE